MQSKPEATVIKIEKPTIRMDNLTFIVSYSYILFCFSYLQVTYYRAVSRFLLHFKHIALLQRDHNKAVAIGQKLLLHTVYIER